LPWSSLAARSDVRLEVRQRRPSTPRRSAAHERPASSGRAEQLADLSPFISLPDSSGGGFDDLQRGPLPRDAPKNPGRRPSPGGARPVPRSRRQFQPPRTAARAAFLRAARPWPRDAVTNASPSETAPWKPGSAGRTFQNRPGPFPAPVVKIRSIRTEPLARPDPSRPSARSFWPRCTIKRQYLSNQPGLPTGSSVPPEHRVQPPGPGAGSDPKDTCWEKDGRGGLFVRRGKRTFPASPDAPIVSIADVPADLLLPTRS